MSFKATFFCFIFILFSTFHFFNLTPIFAQSVTPTSATESSIGTSNVNSSSEPSLWSQFWSWLTTIFIRTDYTISHRPLKDVTSDMTNYGSVSDTDKHSSSATRLTDSNSQTCYKGNVIKKVILETSGYPDSDISHICLDSSNQCSVSTDSSCQTVKISDLAHYFAQTNQQFYCDDKNKLINIESDVIDKINTKFIESVPDYELDCYQTIYKDFYLVPKDTSDENEENSKKIVQTPLPAENQDSTANVQAQKKQLDQNFIPESKGWDGLNSLRPASW